MKTTKREYFAMVAKIVENSAVENKEEILAFLAHEDELLIRKSSKSGQTKTQKENVKVIESIESALREVGKPVTITELQVAVPAMAALTNQKISALMRQMPNVVKTTEKNKSYFSLAE